MLANVRFLAGYRRTAVVASLDEAAMACLRGVHLTIAGAEATLSRSGVSEPRTAVLHLLWSGALRADLGCPLSGDSELEGV